MTSDALGVFDSGVGGLTILRELRRQLPQENVHYLADQQHVPYGARSQEEVYEFADAISQFLLKQGAKLIVVACNTASAAALHTLRERHPEVHFVGMEPAVKPAARLTSTGAVGVLATPATFQGELFASVVERFAKDVRVIQQTLPRLVEQIEAGDLESEATRAILKRGIEPLQRRGVDTIVLACTHYPLVIDLIRDLAGPTVQVIDPSPAIARRAAWLLEHHGVEASRSQSGEITFFSSADAIRLVDMAEGLVGLSGQAVDVRWRAGRLERTTPSPDA
jgi:glutamate racemase